MNITQISSADYVQSTVINADGATPASIKGDGLTAYYTAEGNPPGRWIGSGISNIGRESGGIISSTDAINVWQRFRNPTTGELMGRAPRGKHQKDNQLAESTRQEKRDTAGFDLTFTVPKDVSVLWALSDTQTQAAIARAHTKAIEQAVAYMEQNIAQTRAGHAGVVSMGIKGLIAGKWDHWDTREGDPHLHTHLLLANRVQRASDEKWVTLDSRAFFNNAVHVSELHQNLLMDELTRTLGIKWVERDTVSTRAVVPQIVGMPQNVRQFFSARDRQINEAEARYIEHFRERYGREPSTKERSSIKARAWRATRKAKDKKVMSLANKCEEWKKQAENAHLDVRALVGACIGHDTSPTLMASTAHTVHEALAALTLMNMSDHSPESKPRSDTAAIAEIASSVETELTQRRSTWTAANVRAEVERMTRMLRASDQHVRERTVTLITEAVLARCITITPHRFRVNSDDPRLSLRGRSVFDDLHRARFTSRSALDREHLLVTAMTTPNVMAGLDADGIEEILDGIDAAQLRTRGFALAEDQREAVHAIMTDTTRLSVLLGPAGTGKTTTMSALKTAWETVNGEGTLVGLTTSAQAAHVLGDELDTSTHTISKWLHESTVGNAHRIEQIAAVEAKLLSHETRHELPQNDVERLRRRLAELMATHDAWTLKRGTLLVIDEASMTSTAHLAALTQQADEAGAKVLIVGDHRQLDAVEAGGALALLAEQQGVHELTSVWRFAAEWEADASLALRHVHDQDEAKAVFDTYSEHGRLQGGDDELMLEAAYSETQRAIADGKHALIIGSTNALVDDLNQRFTHDLRAAGHIDASRTVPIRNERDAGLGERILARSNNRSLTDSDGDFVRNGTLMVITTIHTDGSVTATRDDTGATVTLPADYVRENVELGYATTAHRCQGVTVDEARIVIPSDAPIPAELLYVGMTRGRLLNAAYVGEIKAPADMDHVDGMPIAEVETQSWQERLTGMMLISGAEQSATSAISGAHDATHNLARLTAEYEYLTTLEDPADVISTLCDAHKLTSYEVKNSIVLPSLLAAHRAARAASPGVARQSLTEPLRGVSTGDIDAQLRILTSRLRQVAPHPANSANPIPGGVPLVHTTDREVSELAAQVQNAIERRLEELTSNAPSESWSSQCPAALIRDVAIYRDLYQINTNSPLGPEPPQRDTKQHSHFEALSKRIAAAGETRTQPTPRPIPPTPGPMPSRARPHHP